MSALLPTLADLVPIVPESWQGFAAYTPGIVSCAWEWPSIEQRSVRVIVSVDDCGPDGVWLHSSASARRKGKVVLPTWEELVRVKNVVHGDRFAIQILPPRREYVNVTEALHLWERLDAPTLPNAVARASR